MLIGAMLINFPMPSPDLRISDPEMGDMIPVDINKAAKEECVLEVNGTASGPITYLFSGWRGNALRILSIEKHMWLAVSLHKEPRWWYPQEQIDYYNGFWHGPAILGTPAPDDNKLDDMNGREFDIAVIALNKKDNEIFTNYKNTALEHGQSIPVTLPSSAEIVDIINVTRCNTTVTNRRGL